MFPAAWHSPHEASSHTLGLYLLCFCLLSSCFFTYENRALPQGRLQLLSSRPQQQEADYQLHRQNLSCVTCNSWDHKQILEGGSLAILQQYPAKGSSVQLKILDLQTNGSWTLYEYLVNIWVTELILNFATRLLKKSKIMNLFKADTKK